MAQILIYTFIPIRSAQRIGIDVHAIMGRWKLEVLRRVDQGLTTSQS